jgi:beta-glucosidase-like glycosyl hydrolase
MTDEQVELAIEAVVNAMTDDEKYAMLGGTGLGTAYGNAGYLTGVPRLGVPESRMNDGPSGTLSLYPTTNPPIRQLLAATWDPAMAYLYGALEGTENRAIGSNWQLGSQFDIMRMPEFGRAKDQIGEDPYLLGQLATQETIGMQEQGVIAVGKHYVAYAGSASSQGMLDAQVSEQALHEIYMPGFERPIVEGGMLGVMSSYNGINGTYASANKYTQVDVMRGMWNYKGATMTDWGGNHEFTLDKGTDLEMDRPTYNTQANLEKNYPDPEARAQVLNTAIGHTLYALGHAGYLALVEAYEGADGKTYAKQEPGRTAPIKIQADSGDAVEAAREASNAIALEIAENGAVLLKNEGGALPIKGSESVAVLGLGGSYLLSGSGGERSYGTAFEMVSPYQALVDLKGEAKVAAEPVFDVVGQKIPAESLYRVEGGAFVNGVDVAANGATQEPVAEIDYLPEEGSFFGGTAIPNGNAYEWTTYVKAAEDGEHSVILHGIGGAIRAQVWTAGVGAAGEEPAGEPAAASVSYAESQGAQWYADPVSTITGGSLSPAIKFTAEAGKYYKVVVTGTANRAEKDMQVTLAWITPSKGGAAAYQNALGLAASQDKAVVFVSGSSREVPSTRDETWLNLSATQEQLINDVAAAAHAAGKQAVVVLNISTPVTMQNWIDNVDAVLNMYYPGQKGGVATAELLTGAVNPSGRLAYTIPMEGNQTVLTVSDEALAYNKVTQPLPEGTIVYSKDVIAGLTDGEVERLIGLIMDSVYGAEVGVLRNKADVLGLFDRTMTTQSGRVVNMGENILQRINPYETATPIYYEGILTGYRWYDTYGAEAGFAPRYDFGYGLSYTTFEYSGVSAAFAPKGGEEAGYDVTFTVKNTGAVAGSEVAQVYVGQADPALLPEGIQSAPVQLAAFEKVKDLAPGESRTVTLYVNQRALSYWNSNLEALSTFADGTKGKWEVAAGERAVYVGKASDDLLDPVRVAPLDDAAAEGPPAGPDVAPPVITDVRVTGVSPDGFTVTFKATDNVGVTWAPVGAFTVEGWADDAVWSDPAPTGNKDEYSVRVLAADHGGATGAYQAIVWAFDAAGNSAYAWAPEAYVPAAQPPKITNVRVTAATADGFTVTFDVTGDDAVAWVPVGAFTEEGWADDVAWANAEPAGAPGEYSVYVKASDHGGAKGPYYAIVWAYDAKGNASYAWAGPVTLP